MRNKALILCGLFIACNPVDTHKKEDWTVKEVVKYEQNPILVPSTQEEFECPITGKLIAWNERNVLNPAAVVLNDKVFLFFRAQDQWGTSRIGLALSDDGYHFSKEALPVLGPAKDSLQKFEWNYRKLSGDTVGVCATCLFDGVEDPRIVSNEEGDYIMTYTAYDGKTARLCVATSKDLRDWKKHGPAFIGREYRSMWSKSGAIVARQEGERFIAQKINGSYWMYFGDTQLFLARSKDLIHWEVCENAENGKPIAVLNPRPGYFDSRLVEPGPFALFTEEGIRLIYNASNASNFNESTLPKFTYAAGQAHFSNAQPERLIERTPHYFIHPDQDFEREGEVNEVCFVEGMVEFKNQWLLYYGTADSKIAVARFQY
jgi:predicted GH43/DUF377 family glycosyl hydrolase